MLSGQNVLAGSLTILPGTNQEDVAVTFDLTRQDGTFAEIGVFVFDADGTVGGLRPGDDGFEQSVLNSDSRQTLFLNGASTGSSQSLTFLGGSNLGVYYCQNQPANFAENRFEVNPTSENTLQLGFDDTSSLWPQTANVPGSDVRRFDDTQVQVTIGGSVTIQPPVFDAIVPPDPINEQQPFQFTFNATNPDGPDSEIRYRLDAGPGNATLDAITGEFHWTPTEEQGPSVRSITVSAFRESRPEVFATQSFQLTVNEVNRPPVIDRIDDQVATQGQEFTFFVTASDPDRPGNPADPFRFSLDSNAPVGATINPVTGEFSWMPVTTGVFMITVRVVDTGMPALDDTETFTIQVNPVI